MSNRKLAIIPINLSRLGVIILLATSYYLTAEISRYLASTPQSVNPVWPPDGLAVGIMLLSGNWVWSGVFLGSFFANIFAFKDSTTWLSLILSILPVLLIAIGTTLGTLLGCYFRRKFIKQDYPLERITDVLKFLIFTGLCSPIVNATMGVTALTLSNKVSWSAYLTVWLTWWVSNVAGIFIVTPIILSWDWLIRKHQLSWSKLKQLIINLPEYFVNKNFGALWLIIEPIFLLILLILVSQLSFGTDYHLEYMVIPLLIWSAFRMGQAGGTVANFIVAFQAVISTVNQTGGFASKNLNQSLILLESFIGVITLTILVLTAAIAERKEAEAKLQLAFAEIAQSNANLEIRVKQRTEELEQTLESLKRTQLQMIQSEKMSALGQMVAGVAHEINNPVSFIHGNVNYLYEYSQNLIELLQSYQEYYPDPPESLQELIEELDLPFLIKDLDKIFDSIKNGTQRIRSIVISLRNFSRLDEADFKEVDIHEGIDNTLVILQHRLNAQNNQPEIKIIKNYADLPLIQCFAGQLNQVFLNILNNAIDAIRSADPTNSLTEVEQDVNTITIQTQRLDNEQVAIAISDRGQGIPEENYQRIFDPFFTTKPIGQGTGLGLSISYQIITEKHGGKLWFESILGQGTKFVIELPIKLNS